jgi:hypothetical protein
MEHLPTTSTLTNRTLLRAWPAVHPAALADCLFLGAATLLSLVLYVGKLGFYRDDWGFLRWLYTAPDQSIAGLYRALYSGDIIIRQRPAQVFLLAILYRLSGLNPLGYHLANAAILLITAILFYLTLRHLNQPRFLAVAVPLVYLLLPHYSTDRFWIAAFQAPLSISLYFLSLYAGLYGLQGKRGWLWQLLSLLAAAGSLLAYELVLPFLLLNPLLLWYVRRKTEDTAAHESPTQDQSVGWFTTYYLFIAAITLYKLLVSVRVGLTVGLLEHLLGLALGAIRVNYGTYGLGLPYIVYWIMAHRPDPAVFAFACLIGLLTFIYLRSLLPTANWPNRKGWLTYITVGLVIFVLGYAIFLLNGDIWFTSAGQGNRVAIAAAAGVAFTFVGAIGWLAAWLPPRYGRPLVCLLLAILVAAGFLINNTLASYWRAAYQEEQRIVAAIQRQFPTLPAGSTLLVDGICPEVGPAPVFQSAKDLAGALIIAYQDPTLYAIAIPPTVTITATGLALQNGEGKDYGFYPYRENFILYHRGEEKRYDLDSAAGAHQYFHNHVPHQGCPPGFAWGWND